MAAIEPITVIIPALNEERTVATVVARCKCSEYVDQVIVIDNASSDRTASIAEASGATVIGCPIIGLGHAIKAGLRAAKNRWVIKVDADITNFDPTWIRMIAELIHADVGMVKSYWPHEVAAWPETYFLIKPMLRRISPRLASIALPISAIYAMDRTIIDLEVLSSDWSVDLDIIYRVFQSGAHISEIQLPVVHHTERPLTAYFTMADELLNYLLRILDRQSNQRLLLVMAHCDDAEIWAGGAMIKHLLDGGFVDLITIFGGKQRQTEANRLTHSFKRLTIQHFGLDEHASLHTSEFRSRVTEAFGGTMPACVITHSPADPHPDHASTSRLVQAALLTLGLDRHPRRILYCNNYFAGQANYTPFQPDTFVDISAVAETKYKLIGNHLSQGPDFWIQMARCIDILNGMRCGVPCAEAFQRSPHAFYQHAMATII